MPHNNAKAFIFSISVSSIIEIALHMADALIGMSLSMFGSQLLTENKGGHEHLTLLASEMLSLHIGSFFVTASKSSREDPFGDIRNTSTLGLVASHFVF